MAKGTERRRTMVYSNVNKKKADKKSASNKNDDVIDLDNEVFIGLETTPKQKIAKNKKKRNKKKIPYKGNDDLKKLWESEKEELKKEEMLAKGKKEKQNNRYGLNDKEKSKRKKSATIPYRKGQANEDLDFLGDYKNEGTSNKSGNVKKVNNSKGIKSSNNLKSKNKTNNISNTNVTKSQNTKQAQKQNLSPKQMALQEKIRRQKRRIIKKIAMISVLVIMLIGGCIYFLLSPVFNIKEIKVANNTNISSEVIINLSGIHTNENMFKFSKREAKKAILSNPYVEEVQIKRKLFNSVEIDVKERYATLMLEYGNSYVYINNQGYILEISTQKLDVPMLIGYKTPLEQVKPGNRLSKEDLERLKTVLNIIEVASSNGFDSLITKIDIKSKKDFTLTLQSEDKIVYLGECSDLSTQMLFVKEMIEREKGIEGEFFVDMDLNTNKPVFREKV